MTVTITPEMEALVHERISRGQYATPEEVVTAGLRLLRETDARKENELRAMLAEAEEDVRAGRVAPFDPMATAARMRIGKDSLHRSS